MGFVGCRLSFVLFMISCLWRVVWCVVCCPVFVVCCCLIVACSMRCVVWCVCGLAVDRWLVAVCGLVSIGVRVLLVVCGLLFDCSIVDV